MKVTFTYLGYDGENHTYTAQWYTEDTNLAVLMTGRSFEKAIRDHDAMEPAGDHKVIVETV
jgi:hypothetical protein